MKHKKWFIAAWLLAVLCIPSWGWTQKLSDSQYQKLKTDITITNQAEFSADVANSDFQRIADSYNKFAVPDFWVWKTSMTSKDIYESTTQDNTTWDWATYIAQTVQERDAWAVMLQPGTINPSLAQTRGAFTKIFGGTGGAVVAQRTHLLTLSRRQALRGEAVLVVTGLGNGTTATPANLGFEGRLSYDDIRIALTQTP